MSKGGTSHQPKYFYFLNETDKLHYLELRNSLDSSLNRSARNQKTTDFDKALQQIRDFCYQNDSNDAKRCLVCGICWFGHDMAINIKQFSLLFQKSKSSINTTLRKMGFITIAARGDTYADLIKFIPELSGHTSELRKWSVRRPQNFEQNSDSDEQKNEIEPKVIEYAQEKSEPKETKSEEPEEIPPFYDNEFEHFLYSPIEVNDELKFHDNYYEKFVKNDDFTLIF